MALGSESQADRSPNAPRPIFFSPPLHALINRAYYCRPVMALHEKQNSRLHSYSLEFWKFFFLLLIFKEKQTHIFLPRIFS